MNVCDVIPHDKALHFMGGALIALPLAMLSPALAMAVVAVVAAWKEWVYDKARPASHTVDVLDFCVTVAGGLIVCLPAWRWAL